MTNEDFMLNSQQYYFHVSPIKLASGSVILKGNWGRVIRLYMGNCNVLNLFRERVFEDIRQKLFPNKPSRLDCSYLLLDLEAARRYLRVDNEACRTSLIYKVKVCNINASFHLGNFNQVTVKPPLCHFDHMDGLAVNYWNGVGLNDVMNVGVIPDPTNPNSYLPISETHVELLVDSDIEIIECLQ